MDEKLVLPLGAYKIFSTQNGELDLFRETQIYIEEDHRWVEDNIAKISITEIERQEIFLIKNEQGEVVYESYEDKLKGLIDTAKTIINTTVERKLIGKGKLLPNLSKIESMRIQKMIEIEEELKIYKARLVVKDGRVDKVISNSEEILALFVGDEAKIHTSFIQEMCFDKDNSKLYIKTLNSLYCFQML